MESKVKKEESDYNSELSEMEYENIEKDILTFVYENKDLYRKNVGLSIVEKMNPQLSLEHSERALIGRLQKEITDKEAKNNCEHNLNKFDDSISIVDDFNQQQVSIKNIEPTADASEYGIINVQYTSKTFSSSDNEEEKRVFSDRSTSTKTAELIEKL